MLRWLTLYTKPRLERQVSEVLTARGVETLLPIVHEYSEHRRRPEPSPFFPCYLFGRVEPTSPAYLFLNWTPGLRGIVSFDGKVAWVPDKVISQIAVRVAQWEREVKYQDKNRFKPGDRVRIKTGPLQDLEALFDRTLSKAGRVRILLDMLGRWTACELDSDWLEKIG
jgi:transcription antitermination factor NusG